MTHFEAYLLTRLDSVGSFFTLLIIVSCLCLIINFCMHVGAWEERKINRVKERYKYCFVSILIFGFIAILIPSKKEIAFIYIAPAIVNNQDVQKTFRSLPESYLV